MIPDEAVEAAHDAVVDAIIASGNSRVIVRAALEAVAPHLLAPILALSEQWNKQGEEYMADSKTMQDEGIAIEFLKEGAAMVENARHLRNAIAQAGVKA